MSTLNAKPVGRTAGVNTAIALLALLTLSNSSVLAAAIPVPVTVISLALGVAGLAAIAGTYRTRVWGFWLGMIIAIGTALAAAPGAVAADIVVLRVIAGVTAALGAICALLLVAAIRGAGRAGS